MLEILVICMCAA